MERACTTPRKGWPCSQDTPPHSPSAQEPERFPHLLQPKVSLSRCWWHLGQVEHEEQPGLLDPWTRVTRTSAGTQRSLSQFTPVPPHWFASMTSMGAHTELRLAQQGMTGLREAQEPEPSRREHVARTGPCPHSGLCPASHMSLVTSLLPEMPETPGGIPRWKGFRTPGIQNLTPSEADSAWLPAQAGLRDLSVGFH